MTAVAPEPVIQRNAPIPTWFGVGGGAERFCVPRSVEELRRCVEIDPELVVELSAPAFTKIEMDAASGRVVVGAGADLAKVVTESVRQGLGGLEGLGGIPATIGGALMMNAGGAFGEIGSSVVRVFALDRQGRERVLEKGKDVHFAYRHSGLQGFIITGAELLLTPGDPVALRAKLKDVMAYKKGSQPMADNSAGCCFRNPTLTEDVKEIGAKGARVSAGMLIDRAGCKGLRVGGASVSMRHGNFVVTEPGATARDVITLMEQLKARVRDAFGVTIEPEVVVWSRHEEKTRS
jgi:UDP-N-acetylmuramate dehydrogenase